jgi:type II secretory pathway pseudopilin PulG
MKRFSDQTASTVQRQGGFSLFELVVFIICVAIIYATAANRFAQIPAAAERANFMAIVAQIQAGINLQSMDFVINGGASQAQYMDSANPMDFMLEAPSNYLGAYDAVDTGRLPRRTWYFDRASGELVYRVNAEEGVFLVSGPVEVPTDEIRFQLSVQYSYEDRYGREVSGAVFDESGGPGNPNVRRRFRGILFEAVTPYRWDAGGVDLPNVAITESAG